MADSPIEEARREAADESVVEAHRDEEFHSVEPESESEPAPAPARPERRDFRPASPAAVTEAIDEVNRIIVSLKQVLDQMEEVLETLELAEVQKNADEREIQSLTQALRQMDRRSFEPRNVEAPDQPAPYQSQSSRPPHRHDRGRRGRR